MGGGGQAESDGRGPGPPLGRQIRPIDVGRCGCWPVAPFHGRHRRACGRRPCGASAADGAPRPQPSEQARGDGRGAEFPTRPRSRHGRLSGGRLRRWARKPSTARRRAPTPLRRARLNLCAAASTHAAVEDACAPVAPPAKETRLEIFEPASTCGCSRASTPHRMELARELLQGRDDDTAGARVLLLTRLCCGEHPHPPSSCPPTARTVASKPSRQQHIVLRRTSSSPAGSSAAAGDSTSGDRRQTDVRRAPAAAL